MENIHSLSGNKTVTSKYTKDLIITSIFYNFRISWMKFYYKCPTSSWNFILIMSSLLLVVLGLNYNFDTVPLKLSSFHKQMLMALLLIHEHNFTPHRCFLSGATHILCAFCIFNNSLIILIFREHLEH